jgi:hypothetical protein
MTAECQAYPSDEFPARKICAKKLTHRRVLRRLVDTTIAVAGAGSIVTGRPFLNRWVFGASHALMSFDTPEPLLKQFSIDQRL